MQLSPSRATRRGIGVGGPGARPCPTAIFVAAVTGQPRITFCTGIRANHPGGGAAKPQLPTAGGPWLTPPAGAGRPAGRAPVLRPPDARAAAGFALAAAATPPTAGLHIPAVGGGPWCREVLHSAVRTEAQRTATITEPEYPNFRIASGFSRPSAIVCLPVWLIRRRRVVALPASAVPHLPLYYFFASGGGGCTTPCWLMGGCAPLPAGCWGVCTTPCWLLGGCAPLPAGCWGGVHHSLLAAG
eukprot:gene11862-biopygen364